jgi:hypothetical protein
MGFFANAQDDKNKIFRMTNKNNTPFYNKSSFLHFEV